MRLQVIRLADNEYGNTIMREVAEQALAADSSLHAVEIREHGGWWLTFARIGSELEIVGTANDHWTPPAYIREWRASLGPLEFSGPWINRNDHTAA